MTKRSLKLEVQVVPAAASCPAWALKLTAAGVGGIFVSAVSALNC